MMPCRLWPMTIQIASQRFWSGRAGPSADSVTLRGASRSGAASSLSAKRSVAATPPRILCWEMGYQLIWLNRFPDVDAMYARGIELLGDRRSPMRAMLMGSTGALWALPDSPTGLIRSSPRRGQSQSSSAMTAPLDASNGPGRSPTGPTSAYAMRSNPGGCQLTFYDEHKTYGAWSMRSRGRPSHWCSVAMPEREGVLHKRRSTSG